MTTTHQSPAAGDVSTPLRPPVAGSTRPKAQRKRYGRRLAIESVSGTYVTVMPCRDCGVLVVYRDQAAHDAHHELLRRLLTH